MMKKLTRKQFWIVGLMLFSLFFGAGNLIFPPMLGKLAGTSMYLSMFAFGITAVVLPVLGVIAVAKSNGLSAMCRKVSPWFATLFTLVIYLAVGPLMGIPRAATVPYEIGLAPNIPPESQGWSLFLFSCVFFALTYWLSLNPARIADRIGKILSPALLLLMLGLFVCSLINPIADYLPAQGRYQTNPIASGFLEGYMTMDAAGALVFGLVIAMVIQNFKITDKKEVLRTSVKVGVLAGGLLFIIYLMLAYIGGTTTALFPDTTNGAQILHLASNHMFGTLGAYLVASIFTLACLTTCVGLVSSLAQYFTSWTGKFGYRVWVSVWTLCSLLIANFGLDQILSYSVPVLSVIYPIALVLILLSLADSLFGGRKLVYQLSIYTTGAVSLIHVLTEQGFSLSYLSKAVQCFPFSSVHLGWLLPAFLAFSLGCLCTLVQKSYLAKSPARNKSIKP